MIKKTTQAMPVGAKAKQARARELQAQGYFDQLTPGHAGNPEGRWQATLCIFVLGLVLAYFLTDGPIAAGRFGATGVPILDELVLAATPPVLFGMPMADLALVVFIRGLLITVIAGFLPLVAWLWVEVIDRPMMSPYRTVWGVTIGVALVGFFLKPVFAMIASNFVNLMN